MSVDNSISSFKEYCGYLGDMAKFKQDEEKCSIVYSNISNSAQEIIKYMNNAESLFLKDGKFLDVRVIKTLKEQTTKILSNKKCDKKMHSVAAKLQESIKGYHLGNAQDRKELKQHENENYVKATADARQVGKELWGTIHSYNLTSEHFIAVMRDTFGDEGKHLSAFEMAKKVAEESPNCASENMNKFGLQKKEVMKLAELIYNKSSKSLFRNIEKFDLPKQFFIQIYEKEQLRAQSKRSVAAAAVNYMNYQLNEDQIAAVARIAAGLADYAPRPDQIANINRGAQDPLYALAARLANSGMNNLLSRYITPYRNMPGPSLEKFSTVLKRIKKNGFNEQDRIELSELFRRNSFARIDLCNKINTLELPANDFIDVLKIVMKKEKETVTPFDLAMELVGGDSWFVTDNIKKFGLTKKEHFELAKVDLEKNKGIFPERMNEYDLSDTDFVQLLTLRFWKGPAKPSPLELARQGVKEQTNVRFICSNIKRMKLSEADRLKLAFLLLVIHPNKDTIVNIQKLGLTKPLEAYNHS